MEVDPLQLEFASLLIIRRKLVVARAVRNAVDDDILHHDSLPELIEKDTDRGDDDTRPRFVLSGPVEECVLGRGQAFVGAGEGIVRLLLHVTLTMTVWSE